MKTLYSIGHSNKSEEELVAKLQEHGITDLVDVRTFPRSKYNPQFAKAQLERYIPKAGIKYHWRGRNLGGLQGNVMFRETLEKILFASSDERKICVMCSEAKPEECHRTSTIQPVVHELGGNMVHILWSGGTSRDKIDEQARQSNLFGANAPESNSRGSYGYVD